MVGTWDGCLRSKDEGIDPLTGRLQRTRHGAMESSSVAPEGAEMWKISPDGTHTLVGRFSAEKWEIAW